MATSKTSAKVAARKPAVKAEPSAKTRAAAPKTVPKAAPRKAAKPAPKVAAVKPANSRAKKAVGIPAEQRRNYIEVAAYHIAERRGFAPGNTLDDWVQAEAEIDHLLAEGLLGR